MVGIMEICKSLNISIGTVMKTPEMLKFVPDHLKNMFLTNIRPNKCVTKLF